MNDCDLPQWPGAPLGAALIAQSRELHAISDLQGRLVWANRSFRQLFGFHLPVGAELSRCFHAADQPGTTGTRPIAEVLAGDGPAETVVIFDAPSTPDQDVRTIRLHLRVFSLAENRLWILTDISAEHAQKERLQRLEELLDTAQEFGRLGVWERELASGKGRWDNHVFRFWGFDPSRGTPSFADAAERIHHDDRNSREFFESSQRAGRYSQRFRVIQSDGSLRWLHSHWEIKAAADGTPTHAVGVMVDDSETMAMARQLSEATAKLTIAVDLGEIVIFEQVLNTDRMKLNARGCEILGIQFTEDGLPIDEFEQLIHPEDREEMKLAEARAMSERRPVDLQVRHRGRDGQWRHLLSRRVLQRDAFDQPLAFVGVALDVTERVLAQRTLEETARGLEVATTAAGVGIWSRDTNTGDGQWNMQMYRFFDRDPQLGPPSREEWLSTMIHPDDRKSMDSVRLRVHQSPADGATTEYRIIRPDGSVRWLVELARFEERNGRLMIFGATMDITERKNADLAMRKANERIALATRGAGIGTWERDLRTEDVRWDEQMFLLRGLQMPSDADQQARAARVLRKSLVYPADIEQIDDSDRRPCTDASMASHEYRVRWPDGRHRWLASRSIPIFDETGQAVRQIGVEWDVHERVMADEIQREALAARQQSEAKAVLLARISHELRTPLNAILGFTDLISRDLPASTEPAGAMAGKPAGQHERLGHIRNAAERLLELVDDVLDLSKIETGGLNLQPTAIELLPVLQEIVEQNQQKARRRSVRLRLHGDPIKVLADPPRLRQVLSKLVGHHVGSAPARCEVNILVSQQLHEARIALAVRHGPDKSAQQFELFAPAELSTGASPNHDPDFGLFDALLNGMNGRIELRPQDNVGERVVMWLPLAAKRGESFAVADTQAAAGRVARVLYIEDNPVNVILVEELVGQRGDIDFRSASTGSAGVDQTAQFQPDLVLIDIHLPDIDGFEVLRRLRANPHTAATCCVALSANAMPEDVARARAAGFDDYWTKPIRFSSFLAGLNRILPARPLRAAAP
ncbi:MAG: PAS domain-containing protein [Ideonella sp.]